MNRERIKETVRVWQAQPDKAKGKPTVIARAEGNRAVMEHGSFCWHGLTGPTIPFERHGRASVRRKPTPYRWSFAASPPIASRASAALSLPRSMRLAATRSMALHTVGSRKIA